MPHAGRGKSWAVEQVSKAQIERTKNALRGLYTRDPKPRDMQDIRLAAGEGDDIPQAIKEMVRDGELILMQVQDTVYYDLGNKMKAYRRT